MTQFYVAPAGHLKCHRSSLIALIGYMRGHHVTLAGKEVTCLKLLSQVVPVLILNLIYTKNALKSGPLFAYFIYTILAPVSQICVSIVNRI